jgi:hypothetical protein
VINITLGFCSFLKENRRKRVIKIRKSKIRVDKSK